MSRDHFSDIFGEQTSGREYLSAGVLAETVLVRRSFKDIWCDAQSTAMYPCIYTAYVYMHCIWFCTYVN